MNSRGELCPCNEIEAVSSTACCWKLKGNTYRNIVGVYVVGAFVIVDRLQFESRVVVRQDVGETILWSIARQVGECAWLIASNVFEFLEFFAESEMDYD